MQRIKILFKVVYKTSWREFHSLMLYINNNLISSNSHKVPKETSHCA